MPGMMKSASLETVPPGEYATRVESVQARVRQLPTRAVGRAAGQALVRLNRFLGKKIIERARHLGAYLQATQSAEERARSARHSIPEAVLAETAMLDFLHQ